jgi:hypothetical protein
VDQAIKTSILIAALVVSTLIGHAQYNLGFQEAPNALALTVNGEALAHAAIGGFNTPQFSSIDLNFDGHLDLFVFDRGNDVVRTFLYNSATQQYDYAPAYEKAFPSELKEFALLRDFDCDGHMDIFTYYLAGFRVFRNNGTAPLSFTKVTDKIRSDYGSINTGAFVLAGDIPALEDVDGDGDLDILAFGTVNSENTIEFHRNLSQDLYGNCDSLEFEVVTQCWGNIEEPLNASVLNAISCKGVVPPDRGGRMHPGSTILLLDADADGDKDLVVGDIQTDHVVFAINAGDANVASIDVNQQTHDFPNATDPVQMQYLISGFQIDVDHDGIQDLLMSVNNTIDSSVNTGHVWYYRNTSSSIPSFSLQSKSFLLADMLDLGAASAPIAMDVNGDGKKDLLIANDYSRGPIGGSKSRLHYFEQQSNGSFLLVNNDFATLSTFGFEAINLALGDLDGDGDLDMLLGDQDGYLHFFRNNPVGGNATFTLAEAQYQGINSIGSNASPELADVNGDGLLDLLVGDRIGEISYFENLGSSSSASFTTTPTISKLGNIDVSTFCCIGHAQPRWIDDPSLANGRYLMVGSDEKRIDIYAVPNDIHDTWPLIDTLSVRAGRLSPRFVDLDNDGIYELLSGTAEGGIKYFERGENVLIGIQKAPSPPSFSIFPSPNQGAFTLESTRPWIGSIEVINLSGQLVFSQSAHFQSATEFHLDHLGPGHYFVRCRLDHTLIVTPLIILQ